MTYVTSRDGTRIAFTKTGQGKPVIIVNGAMGFREFHGDKPLASMLSKDFTVYIYDRRGRGESSDRIPYSVEREIEDIEALIDDAGGSAFVYGVSSGAALSLHAAAALGPSKINRLALYEPPYGSDAENEKQEFATQRNQLHKVILHGKPGDAAAFFVTALGTPPEALDSLRQTPDWTVMIGVEHTLAYDYAVLGDGAVPTDLARAATMPVLVMDGEKTLEFMHTAAETLGAVLPSAQRKTIKDQTHEVSAEAMAPVLKVFFLGV